MHCLKLIQLIEYRVIYRDFRMVSDNWRMASDSQQMREVVNQPLQG